MDFFYPIGSRNMFGRQPMTSYYYPRLSMAYNNLGQQRDPFGPLYGYNNRDQMESNPAARSSEICDCMNCRKRYGQHFNQQFLTRPRDFKVKKRQFLNENVLENVLDNFLEEDDVNNFLTEEETNSKYIQGQEANKKYEGNVANGEYTDDVDDEDDVDVDKDNRDKTNNNDSEDDEIEMEKDKSNQEENEINETINVNDEEKDGEHKRIDDKNYEEKEKEMNGDSKDVMKEDTTEEKLKQIEIIRSKVNELTDKVNNITINIKSKEYLYCEEMLTKCLLELDDILANGQENVRQSRRSVVMDIEKDLLKLETRLK